MPATWNVPYPFHAAQSPAELPALPEQAVQSGTTTALSSPTPGAPVCPAARISTGIEAVPAPNRPSARLMHPAFRTAAATSPRACHASGCPFAGWRSLAAAGYHDLEAPQDAELERVFFAACQRARQRRRRQRRVPDAACCRRRPLGVRRRAPPRRPRSTETRSATVHLSRRYLGSPGGERGDI